MAVSRTSGTQPAFAPAESPAAALAHMGEMNIEQLRGCWRETIASDPPAAFSKDLLARAICYRLQEQTFGGLSASTDRLLRALVKPGAEPPRRVKVGSVLIREHQGVVHEVLVVPGGFCWQGKTCDKPLDHRQEDHWHELGTALGSSGSDQRICMIRSSVRPPVRLLLTATASPNIYRVGRLLVGLVAVPPRRRDGWHPC